MSQKWCAGQIGSKIKINPLKRYECFVQLERVQTYLHIPEKNQTSEF
jgi:hypothetical protein